jgi:hypothetical protein
MSNKNVLVVGASLSISSCPMRQASDKTAGANRGIGHNLVKAYTAKSWHVTGTIRPQSRDDVSVKDVIAPAKLTLS